MKHTYKTVESDEAGVEVTASDVKNLFLCWSLGQTIPENVNKN
jgi:hypothetical protein